MTNPRLVSLFALAAAAGAGCYTGGNVSPTGGGGAAPPPTASVNGTEPAAGSVTGIPCDVAKVLAATCASCHATTPSGGAPNAMVTYEDLVAPSATNPAVTIAAMSVTRMKDAKNPMPPDGASADDLAVIEAWISAGMPKGTDTCDATPAPSVYDTPSVCTTNQRWTQGDHGSKNMRPGGACIDCHERQGEGPSYAAAGTVYATAHEPDDCYGGPAGVTVSLTDATGRTYTAAVNAAGNFYFDSRSKIVMPYKAKVTSGSKSRAMSSAQKDGDCNKCHTEAGLAKEKTPGRVMAP